MENYLYCRDLFEFILGDKGRLNDMVMKSELLCTEKLLVILECGLVRIFFNALLMKLELMYCEKS